MSNEPAPPPTWDDLKQLLRWFVTLFGDPKRLFEDQVVRKQDGFIIRGWLAGLEAIARALLMTMAAALPAPGKPAAAGAKAVVRKATARKPEPSTANDIVVGAFDAPDSERWADVRFILLPPAPRPWRRRARHAKLPSSLIRTRPLAFRFEALLRVAQRPDRYAARLARRLHADPDVAARLLRRPEPIHCSSFPRADVHDAQAAARRSWRALKTDTPASDTG